MQLWDIKAVCNKLKSQTLRVYYPFHGRVSDCIKLVNQLPIGS